jgi:hypothetical protein
METSKLKLMLVTVGVITGIIGILTGCLELLNGSLLVEGHNITALPDGWPNQEFYSKMQGMPVFSILTGIPYYVVGLLSIAVSITLIVCSLTVVEVSKFGVAIFSLLTVGVFCFGASKSIPIIEMLPAIICAVLALTLKERQRSSSGKRKLLTLFNFFYWWNISSWVLFFPVIFVLSFYQEISEVLFKFMGMSMIIATSGGLISALLHDKSIPINEV